MHWEQTAMHSWLRLRLRYEPPATLCQFWQQKSIAADHAQPVLSQACCRRDERCCKNIERARGGPGRGGRGQCNIMGKACLYSFFNLVLRAWKSFMSSTSFVRSAAVVVERMRSLLLPRPHACGPAPATHPPIT